MTSPVYDAVVIGGGVTGAGLLRELSRRGVDALLLEKGDYGGGTSGGSSWMIHGGPRYLEYDWDTTRLSCEDAGHIVTLAKHLVHRVVFLIPIMPGDRNGLERMETAMEVYDRFQPLKHAHPHVRLTRAEAREAEPGLSDQITGAVTMEEWGVDPHRLTWLNVADALGRGARAQNHARVIGLLRDGPRVLGVRYQSADGGVAEARARVVINAAGPWVPEVCRMAGVDVTLRPAKGIHIVYDRRVSNFAVAAEAVDGRQLLLIPHGPFSILGTTDDDYYGDLDRVEVLPDEPDYLLQAFERVFPAIRDYRPVRVTTGVRPTLFRWRMYEDDLSRRYEVIDHEERDGVAGLVTIAGGKLSMYRLMAEQTADAVCDRLGIDAPVPDREEPLPGSESEAAPAEELARRHGVSAYAAARLLRRHGCRSESVLAGAGGPARTVCRCEPVLEADLVHAVRHEQVRTLGDAFRRVGLASGPCAGAACLERAATVIGRELGWSAGDQRDRIVEFRRGLWHGRAPILDQAGWAQEELTLGAGGYRTT